MPTTKRSNSLPTPANALRKGDILEPDGTEVLRVWLPERGIDFVTVVLKPGRSKKKTRIYYLDPTWPLYVRTVD